MPVPPAPALSFSRRILVAAAVVATIAILLLIRGLRPPDAVPPVEPTTATRTSEGSRPLAADHLPTHSLAPRWEEQEPQPPPRTGNNAADSYRKAFGLFDQLSEEEKTMLRKPGEEVDAEKAAALFEKIRAIMELLRAAVQAGYCDWGLGPITFETPMPHLTKAQDLGKLALWAAAWQFPSDPAAAIGDLQLRAQLGHHLGDTLIGVLVESSMESGATKLLLQNAALLDTATIGPALALIGSSMIDQDLSRAFAMDAEMVAGFTTLGSGGEEKRKEILSMLGNEAAPVMDRLLRDPVRLAAEVALIREVEGNMAAAMRLPEAQFQAWWKGVQSQLQGDHPLARMTLSTFEGVQRKAQQLRVERTLLSAGLDVLQHGPAQLPRYRDPATGNALLYVPTATGFDLRSTYQVKGKPVSLSFSQPR